MEFFEAYVCSRNIRITKNVANISHNCPICSILDKEIALIDNFNTNTYLPTPLALKNARRFESIGVSVLSRHVGISYEQSMMLERHSYERCLVPNKLEKLSVPLNNIFKNVLSISSIHREVFHRIETKHLVQRNCRRSPLISLPWTPLTSPRWLARTRFSTKYVSGMAFLSLFAYWSS